MCVNNLIKSFSPPVLVGRSYRGTPFLPETSSSHSFLMFRRFFVESLFVYFTFGPTVSSSTTTARLLRLKSRQDCVRQGTSKQVDHCLYRKMEQEREVDSKENMESEPDYESGENTTFPKIENTLGRTQEVAPSQEDAPPPPVASDVLGSLARTLHQLSAANGLSREVELPRYDGSYEAQSFFDNYDAQADRAQLQYTERLRRLPNLLQGKALHYFRSLKLDKLYYVDARQALIDLFPETTNASFARFLAIKRPEQLPTLPSHRHRGIVLNDLSARPNYAANPPPSSCRYCGAMHWHAQCPKRPAQSRPRPVYLATTYPQHKRTVLSSPAPFQVTNTRVHVTCSPDPLYTTSPAQAVNSNFPRDPPTTAPDQACPDPQDSTTKARQLAFSRTQLKHERDNQRYDKGHQALHFEIGDLVLVKNYKHPDTGKLAPYFTEGNDAFSMHRAAIGVSESSLARLLTEPSRSDLYSLNLPSNQGPLRYEVYAGNPVKAGGGWYYCVHPLVFHGAHGKDAPNGAHTERRPKSFKTRAPRDQLTKGGPPAYSFTEDQPVVLRRKANTQRRLSTPLPSRLQKKKKKKFGSPKAGAEDPVGPALYGHPRGERFFVESLFVYFTFGPTVSSSTMTASVVMKSNREFENRAAIIVALRAGKSPKEIVDFLKLPKTTIYRVKKQFDEADSNKERIATRKKHSRRSDRVRGEEFVKNVKEKIGGNPGKSMRAIAKEMDVGSMTIVRTIHEDLGLKSYALRKGQLLTENMKNNRKGKAAALLNNLKHDSFGMLRFFSDEKNFDVDQKVNPRNDRWICKDPLEIPVVMHTKFPASVMVLGVISSEGDVMPPHFFEKGLRMNADTYINVLETVVKPWMDMVAAGRKYVFQQDSAPAHKAKKTQSWLTLNVPSHWGPDIWPPNSPDCNPLDYYVWGVVERDVNKAPHTTIQSVKKAVHTVMTQMDKVIVAKACASFRTRLETVVANNGNYIE
ncbi:hypothetical protein LAZ67_3005915 [Cordylochernes scorpioides]|uniref:Transposase n=1 Tax=Cordylochernes scorpioides TaxID=51811 RepID=A0ABY6KBK8_9ARAC|nr:hypothetical protein LAZ67_3005915 [Cordylochernes scorpioides]